MAVEPANVNGSFATLLLAAVLAFIPAFLAKKKGYSFGVWWFYGWMLFIVAIIHICLIGEKTQPSQATLIQPITTQTRVDTANYCIADEIRKYKSLYDEGILTEEEFNRKKEQLLRKM